MTILCLFVCWSSLVAAAETAVRVEGRVVKKGTENGIGGVVVQLNELKLTTDTDEHGKFILDRVPPGTYSVVLSLGDENAVQQLVIAEGGSADVKLEVDWAVRGYEAVTVVAEELAAKVVDAPAAITSIPAKQIEQQASQGQVPKILEFTPGAEVTQSGLYDFNFNTRGFNSSLNRRVSTYIDGRDVGVVLLGAQEWAAIAGGLDDVANLEFIRGPSAALYGANASSGVVNITSKSPRSSLGGLARITVGELRTRSIDVRHAFDLGHGWYGKVLGGSKESGDFSVSRDPFGPDGVEFTGDDIRYPEYSQFCLSVGQRSPSCLPEERNLYRSQYDDSWSHARDELLYGGLRFDKYLTDASLITLEAGYSTVKGPVFQTGIGRVQDVASERPFFRFAYASPHWHVLGHWTSRTGHQVNLVKALRTDYDLYTDDHRYGVEAQGNWSFFSDKLRWVIGAAYTAEGVDTQSPFTNKQTVVYKPIRSNRQAIFTQLDYRASEHFKLVFAGRVDASTLHDTQFSPKAAVVYSINENNSLRLTYNRAFQVANYSEFFLHTPISYFPIGSFIHLWCELPFAPNPVDCGIPAVDPATGQTTYIPILAVGNNDLKLEKTEAWELGYSGVLASKVFMTVDYYRSKNKDFITDLVPQIGTILGNTDNCIPEPNLPSNTPENDLRKRCPINNSYLPWISTLEAETTLVGPNLTVAQAVRNSVQQSVGANTQPDGQGGTTSTGLGFRFARDINGNPVIIGRTYANVGLVDTQGVDFGLQYFITHQLNVQLNYSWFDYKIVEAGDLKDLQEILLPNTPTNKASLGITYLAKNWSVSAAGRWVQGFQWSTGIFAGDIPDYSTIDLSGSYRFNKTFQLGANVANARDSIHRQTFGGDLLRRRALVNLTTTW